MAVDMSCPNCHQLDAVRNVQSIVSGGSYLGASGTPATTTRAGVTSFPVGGSMGLESGLAMRLAPPPEPQTNGSVLPFLGFVPGVAFCLAGILVRWVWCLPGVALLGLGVWVVMRLFQVHRDHVAAWRPLMKTWTALLYCARCDMVWHPDRRMPVRPEQRQQLWA